MLLSKYQFHRNAIITGCIDSFCLVCESHLRCEEDSRSHIDKPVHRKNLDATPYFDKYKDELVRKVKRGYFCELCNLLIATAAKVGLHIVEPFHINNKGIQSLKRVGNAVLVFRDVLIPERAWQGLIEDTCVLCNQEFHNELIHKTQASHILNLVQIKVEFGVGEAIFRRTDDSAFQCLTCNEMFSMDSLRSHFTAREHLDALQTCRETALNNGHENGDNKEVKTKTPTKTQNETFDTAAARFQETIEAQITSNNVLGREHLPECPVLPGKNYPKISGNNETAKSDTIISNNDSKEQNGAKTSTCKENGNLIAEEKERNWDRILENIADFQKNHVAIDFETEIAYCKKCFDQVPLFFNDIHNHITDHNNKPRNCDITTPVLDQNNCKIQLKNTDEDPKFDQNHNVKAKVVDLTTGSVGANCYLVPYIPIANNEVVIQEESPTETPAPPETNDPAVFSKQHKLTYNKGNFDAFCRICRIKLPSSIKSMKEHVFGAKHKKRVLDIERLEMQSNKSSTRKRKLGRFVRDLFEMGMSFGDVVVLNDKICVSYCSYNLLTEQMGMYRCQLCEVTVYKPAAESHTSSERHEDALDETPVLVELNSEFVREVRPGLFHCGFCNLIAGDYTNLSRHLACDDHRKNKMAAEERLALCMPSIMNQRRAQEQQDNMIMGMLAARFGWGR